MPKKKLKASTAKAERHAAQSSLKSGKGYPGPFININAWFNNNHSGFLVFLLVISFIFSLLHFNIRISEGGDDSTYIEAGYQYAEDFFNYHFTYNAPLYPMFLSVPIKIFGINLKILKFISIVFSLLHIIFLYLAFNKRIPGIVLFPVLFIVSVNAYFLYYASQTYNEAFFLFVQALFFYASFRLVDITDREESLNIKTTYKQWLFFGFTAFIFALSKNIALIGLISVIAYFFLNRKFLNSVYALLSFLLFRIPYEIFSYFVWTGNMQHSSQLSTQMLKDAYHPEKGNEDLAGFFDRFLQNADLYFSRRLMHILNFKPEADVQLNSTETIIVSALLVVAFFVIWRSKNKYLRIASFYTFPMIAATFLLLQITWDQPRLILIFVPFMLLIIFYAFYYLAHHFKNVITQVVFCALVLYVVFLSCVPAIKKAKSNLPVLRKNLRGDMYYGYTPDWVNFLRMSEWCGNNLPDSAFIASRKPSMSFIYSNGKKFYPVFTVNTTNPDSVLMELKENKVTHALVSNLRKDKSKPADSTNVINTIHRLLKPVVDKYPHLLKLVHKEGDKEPSYLLEVNYPDSIGTSR